MGLKIVIEQEDSESEMEDSCECPKCGAECESEDKFCCECGAKLPTSPKVAAGARMGAMQKAMSEMED